MKQANKPRDLVILVHGIRDFAIWQTTIRSALESNGFEVEAVNYGRFNLLQFLVPFAYFRKKAIETVWKQIRVVKQNNAQRRISVIAHSFGTFVIAHIMQDGFDIRFHRVIFCGSVLPFDFPFEQFQNRFTSPIVNEVGTQDIWPAIAESVTTGYGSAGTYGFRRPLVRDRWHNGARHGYFLTANFCSTFWIPVLRDGVVLGGSPSPESPVSWLRLLSIFKIKYALLLVLVGALLYFSILSGRAALESVRASNVTVPNPNTIGSAEDYAAALEKIARLKPGLGQAETKRISAEITANLLPNNSRARVTNRYKNKSAVETLLHLNNNDLSHVWRDLPENVDLSYLDLSGVNLRGVKFKKSFLIYTKFTSAKLDDVNFDDAFVRNADFSNATLSEVRFESTDWFNAYGLQPIEKSGVPIPYTDWMDCPRGYKSPDNKAFIASFDKTYGVGFAKLELSDSEALAGIWRVYSAAGGTCDLTLR